MLPSFSSGTRTTQVKPTVRVHVPVGGGGASLRLLANHARQYRQLVPGVSYQDLGGELRTGLPALQSDIGASYSEPGITGTSYGTFVGSGYYDKPMAALTENDHVSHLRYLGAALRSHVPVKGGHGYPVYANVSNLLNQAPPSTGFGTLSSLVNGNIDRGSV